MKMRFRDDVTETEILSLMGDSLPEDETLLDFGSYSRIDVGDIFKLLGLTIICTLAVPIQTGVAITMVLSLIKYSYELHSSSLLIGIPMILFAGVLTFVFILIPVGLIVLAVTFFRSLFDINYTVYYAYSASSLYIKFNDSKTKTYKFSNFQYVKAKKCGRYGKIYGKYLLFLHTTLLTYVEDAEKFCKDIYGDPEVKIYLNNKEYS